jgi:hypothetical protein
VSWGKTKKAVRLTTLITFFSKMRQGKMAELEQILRVSPLKLPNQINEA